MKFSLIFSIISMACLSLVSADSNAGKVKLVNIELIKISKEYFNTKTIKVDLVKINETYNAINADFDVKKNFPQNTQYIMHVSRSDLSYSGCDDNYEEIGSYNASLCNNDHYKYAEELSKIKTQFHRYGKCLPKDHYAINDVGYFEFYNLLSEEELCDSCFKATGILSSGDEVLYAAQLDFVSN